MFKNLVGRLIRTEETLAVFLRAMEYYRGILFLTTNRVGKFDDAFMSRIHVVIGYEDLGQKQQEELWNGFFKKLEIDRPDIIVDGSTRRYLNKDSIIQELKLNGREIRNGETLLREFNRVLIASF